MPMNEYAADVTAQDYAIFDRVLSAEVAKFEALGDSETARRLFTIGAWVAREYLMLAAARKSLGDQLLNGGPFDAE
jgi:hypothetical protein